MDHEPCPLGLLWVETYDAVADSRGIFVGKYCGLYIHTVQCARHDDERAVPAFGSFVAEFFIEIKELG